MKLCSICDLNQVKACCYESSAKCGKQCTATLPCGHTVSWTCAPGADPRLSPDFKCVGCVIPLWEQSLSQDLPAPLHCEAFLEDMRSKISDIMREYEIEYALPIETSLNKFLKSRQTVLKKFCDQMRLGNAEVRDPPAVFGSLEDLAHYDLVFISARVKDKKGQMIPNDTETVRRLSQFLTNRDGTIMGMGARLMLLSDASVLENLDDEDGRIKVSVGIAFAYHQYPSNIPFRVTNEKSANKKSNELAVKYMEQGYDHVSIHPDKLIKKGIFEKVYWQPGAVIPLSILCLKVKSICCICGESESRNDGYMCNQSHFVCFGCFKDYAQSASADDAIARCVDAEGNLRCPNCSEAYDLYRVASRVPPDVLQSIADLKFTIKSNSKGKAI